MPLQKDLDQVTNALITGAGGLIGSAVARHLLDLGWDVAGVDNNQRARFFGSSGDTRWMARHLADIYPKYQHFELDIRNRPAMFRLICDVSPALVVHAAAQPSHDLAARIPLDDFDVNAVGTLNLLEGCRLARDAEGIDPVFVLLSTNKVYGDAPNELPVVELATRLDYCDPHDWAGIDETMRIDQSVHSLFGVSKAAADLLTQEYGRYFGLRTGVFRGGCLTGGHHAGVELHGFLSHLFKTVASGGTYTVFGYAGKQLRDNIHSADVATAILEFYWRPACGEVYNLGGERRNSCSVREALSAAQAILGSSVEVVDSGRARQGDHRCYVTNMAKFRDHYPNWSPAFDLPAIYADLAKACGSQ